MQLRKTCCTPAVVSWLYHIDFFVRRAAIDCVILNLKLLDSKEST